MGNRQHLLLTPLNDLSNEDFRETRDYLSNRLRYLLAQCLLNQLIWGVGQ